MITVADIAELAHSHGLLDDAGRFDGGAKFRDIGIDSLDAMTLFLAVEEKYGVKLTEQEADSIDSPAALVRILNSRGV